ncbi:MULTISPECIES: sensor histidine kinase [Nocardioides]|uniref:histidine kinase n=1 Tax=Nocardioides vastitatis TaxID=2568655 RepID=A0ABW0ZG49_9ACTN|nr:HAMP domain-containing sensor histidine kinase [Nocardioides sp.]THI92750.1 HAMP domain-containing histidine kinase [Nocardioides sp.]
MTTRGDGLGGLSVRWRLTAVYTAVAVASAAVLLAGIYVLVSLDQRSGRFIGTTTRLDSTSAVPPPGNDMLVKRAIIDAQGEAVDSTLGNLLLWSGIGLVLMTAVSVYVGWLFAGRALRPVHTITSRARRISADSLDERLALEGPRDELREMAETFDSLLDRIQEAFESERRLVATMSHELRTPLANQRTALDVALADPDADAADLRRAGEVALGQAERAQRTVDGLLTLARVQAGVEAVRLGPVAFDEVVRAAVDAARQDAPSLAWEVGVDPVMVRGDAELLARAVGNLVQNAVVHNVPDGWVRVRLLAGVGAAVLEVANSGPRVPPDTVHALTLPFRRGSADRTTSDRGTGLGLTIVQAVADHHGAGLRLTPLPDGGLQVELSLPLGP